MTSPTKHTCVNSAQDTVSGTLPIFAISLSSVRSQNRVNPLFFLNKLFLHELQPSRHTTPCFFCKKKNCDIYDLVNFSKNYN